jgi:hypothetical protein
MFPNSQCRSLACVCGWKESRNSHFGSQHTRVGVCDLDQESVKSL